MHASINLACLTENLISEKQLAVQQFIRNMISFDSWSARRSSWQEFEAPHCSGLHYLYLSLKHPIQKVSLLQHLETHPLNWLCLIFKLNLILELIIYTYF